MTSQPRKQSQSLATKASHAVALLRYYLRAIDRLAWLGLALFCGAAAVQYFQVGALEAQDAAVRSAMAQRRHEVPKVTPEQAHAQQMDALAGALPDQRNALRLLAGLHAAAQKNGVHLATGEYRIQRQTGHSVQRYQWTFPAQASYPALQSWLGQVLNADPTLALDALSLQREDANAASLEVHVRFSQFMKAP